MYHSLCEYNTIPDSEWIYLQKKIHVETIRKDNYFIKAGDRPDKIAFLVAGLFRIFYLNESGKENTLVFRDENKFLAAYSSFLENSNSKFYFQALEDSVLLYISIKDYLELSAQHSCWQNITTKYSQYLFVEKEKRELEFLCDDAEKRYRNFASSYPKLISRVPQFHIASYIGITPEALSRIRKKLKLT